MQFFYMWKKSEQFDSLLISYLVFIYFIILITTKLNNTKC